MKRWLIGKDPDAGGNWGQKKGATEDEMAGWHHWHDGHEFEQASGEWWRTGKAGMLQSMGSQRVGHDLAIEWQKSDISDYVICHLFITPSLLSFLIKDADSVSNYSPTICPYFQSYTQMKNCVQKDKVPSIYQKSFSFSHNQGHSGIFFPKVGLSLYRF